MAPKWVPLWFNSVPRVELATWPSGSVSQSGSLPGSSVISSRNRGSLGARQEPSSFSSTRLESVAERGSLGRRRAAKAQGSPIPLSKTALGRDLGAPALGDTIALGDNGPLDWAVLPRDSCRGRYMDGSIDNVRVLDLSVTAAKLTLSWFIFLAARRVSHSNRWAYSEVRINGKFGCKNGINVRRSRTSLPAGIVLEGV